MPQPFPTAADRSSIEQTSAREQGASGVRFESMKLGLVEPAALFTSILPGGLLIGLLLGGLGLGGLGLGGLGLITLPIVGGCG